MSERSLESELVEQIGLGVVVWQLAGALQLVAANAAAARIGQLDFAARIGRSLAEGFPEAFAQGRHLVYAEVLCAGVERPLPVGAYAELGKKSVCGRMVPLAGGYVAVVFDDATGRELAEDETRKLNTFLDSIIDNIPAMVFVKDAEHLRYELFNRAGEALSGFKRADIYGKSARDLFPKEQADFFLAKDRAVLDQGHMLDIPEEPINTPLGKRWLHTKKIPIMRSDGTPSHLLGISLDISERKAAQDALEAAHRELELRVEERTRELVLANQRLKLEMDERQRTQEALAQAEEQLRQAQKMEAVGRLAGGIAHDFNNLLSVILSYAGLLTDSSGSRISLAEGVTEIKKASQRAATLTRQLLAFSRQQVLAPRVVDLNEIVQSMSSMLRSLIGEDVQLSIVREPSLGRTRADVSQFEQVIMNLVLNARDAMPGGGEIRIETGNLDVDAQNVSAHPGVALGSYVVLTVRDSGVGMDAPTLTRVFEPFFTTKQHGKGTGLGLSTVYGIVKQSGGHIAVESVPGRGATFRVYAARTNEPSSYSPPPERTHQPARGSETLLLVEDDDQVRAIAREILEVHGYRVLEAARPSLALELSQNFAERIDLLITDVVMPEMNGRLLAERLREGRSALRVLYMSGYTDHVLDTKDALASAAFLSKPLTPASLTGAVRRLLDEPLSLGAST